MEWISRFRHASRNWELGMNRLRSLSDLKDGVVESPFCVVEEEGHSGRDNSVQFCISITRPALGSQKTV
jgi:hypothetical protein